MQQLKAIQDFIDKNNIKPSNCAYHTCRTKKNAKGEDTGQIRVLALKGEVNAHCEYVCPECGQYGYVQVEWKRPFYVKCKCGFKLSVAKMRQEFKKEQKAEQKAAKKK